MRPDYETDDDHFDADAYMAQGYRGVAWRVLGWEIEPDEDTTWTGFCVRTGRVVAVMIGDDRYFTFDEEEIAPIAREEYCGECGQIGCRHDGLDRD